MSERRITISPKVDRKIYFRFKDLCHAHGIAVERGVEQAMKEVLDRAGVAEADLASTLDPVSTMRTN